MDTQKDNTHDLEKEIIESDMKNYSGLQEILEEAVGKEKALSIIYEIN